MSDKKNNVPFYFYVMLGSLIFIRFFFSPVFHVQVFPIFRELESVQKRQASARTAFSTNLGSMASSPSLTTFSFSPFSQVRLFPIVENVVFAHFLFVCPWSSMSWFPLQTHFCLWSLLSAGKGFHLKCSFILSFSHVSFLCFFPIICLIT